MSAFVFGPVPSRRLGRSLGVDLVPFKTCPYDCIYCQLGRTTNKTVQRREWVPLGQVLCDIEARLDSQPDYITLSGSGEPTLYSRIDELIAGIKQLTTTPVAVLTNGALLSDPSVRRSLRAADVIAPSLDAPDAALFQHVNRPHPSVHFEEMLRGLVALRHQRVVQVVLFVVDQQQRPVLGAEELGHLLHDGAQQGVELEAGGQRARYVVEDPQAFQVPRIVRLDGAAATEWQTSFHGSVKRYSGRRRPFLKRFALSGACARAGSRRATAGANEARGCDCQNVATRTGEVLGCRGCPLILRSSSLSTSSLGRQFHRTMTVHPE